MKDKLREFSRKYTHHLENLHRYLEDEVDIMASELGYDHTPESWWEEIDTILEEVMNVSSTLNRVALRNQHLTKDKLLALLLDELAILASEEHLPSVPELWKDLAGKVVLTFHGGNGEA